MSGLGAIFQNEIFLMFGVCVALYTIMMSQENVVASP